MEPNVIGIYEIFHTPTQMRYIGSSVDLTARLTKHRNELRNNIHHCYRLQKLWNESSESEWLFRVLSEHARDDLRHAERCILKGSANLLNTMTDVVPGLGKREVKAELSRQMWMRPGFREKASVAQRAGWEKNRHYHLERMQKAGAKLHAEHHNPEAARANVAIARNKRNELLRDDVDGSFRRKMGAGIKSSWKTDRKRLVEAIKGGWKKNVSDPEFMAAWRAQKSAAMKAFRATPEGKAALARSHAARWGKVGTSRD